jgi:transcriptional regulator with XRE-family HTH domain
MGKLKRRTLGDKVREARIAEGLTQEELVKKSGVGLRTIQDMEAGRGAKTFYIDCVATALNKSRVDFLPKPEPGNDWQTALTGINGVESIWHSHFSGAPENVETIQRLFLAAADALSTFSELLEYLGHKSDHSMFIRLRMPSDKTYSLATAFVAGEFDRIKLKGGGIASIDNVHLPSDTLDSQPFGYSSRETLRLGIEYLAQSISDGVTTIQFNVDGSADLDRHIPVASLSHKG